MPSCEGRDPPPQTTPQEYVHQNKQNSSGYHRALDNTEQNMRMLTS